MPTLHPCILKKKDKNGKMMAKSDGTYNVFIRLTHKRQVVYIETPFYASRADLDKSYEVKDRSLLQALNKIIITYQDEFKNIGLDVYRFSSADLKKYLTEKYLKSADIDFIKYGWEHMDRLKKAGGTNYPGSFRTTINALVDFFGRKKVFFDEITAGNLKRFEAFLSSEREITRVNQNILRTRKVPGVSVSAIKNYMTNIRTLFNLGRSEFNDPEKGQIKIAHYPFGKYEIPEPGPTKGRALEPETIRLIREFPDFDNNLNGHKTGANRVNLGRDVFMLVIYLLGINTADLYTATRLEKGRLVYNRKKTKGKKFDSALMSVKVPDLALQLFEKYRDKTGKRVFNFYQLYKSADSFNTNANKGMKAIAEKLGLENLTSYYARHSFATIARNNCGFSLEDVAEAMNHSPGKHKVTDIYIKKTWDRVDKVQEAVLKEIL